MRCRGDGIADTSPFRCMNEVVSEAIDPKLSRGYAGIPTSNSDHEREIEIDLELTPSYRQKKPIRVPTLHVCPGTQTMSIPRPRLSSAHSRATEG